MVTFIVTTLLDVWLNAVEEFGGSPLTWSDIGPVRLPLTAAVIWNEAVPPCLTVAVGGVTINWNVEDRLTVSVTVAVALSVPLTPVTITLYVPAAAVDAAVSVSELVPPGATLAGVNRALTPAGRPAAPSVISPLKPPVAADPIVVETLAPPAASASAAVGVLSVKPGAGFSGVAPEHDDSAL